MTDFLDSILLLGLAGALLAPLGYALTTLRGLKARRFYPIFRFHAPRIGTFRSQVEPQRNGTAAAT